MEKRTQIPVRLPEQLAREFKAACALEGTSGQEVLLKAVIKFMNKKRKTKLPE